VDAGRPAGAPLAFAPMLGANELPGPGWTGPPRQVAWRWHFGAGPRRRAHHEGVMSSAASPGRVLPGFSGAASRLCSGQINNSSRSAGDPFRVQLFSPTHAVNRLVRHLWA